MKARTVIVVIVHGSRGGHAPANPLRRSLPGADRVKPERNLGAAKLPSTKGGTNLRPSPAQVTEPPYADPPVRWWEGRSREASPYPDFRQFTTEGDCRSFAASLNPKLVIGLSNGIVSD